MKIKNLEFKENALILSPMAGVGDFAFRAQTRKFGADFSYTEMVSCKALIYGSEKTLKMLHTLPEEKSCGVQLLGSDPEDFAKVVQMDCIQKFDVIDINFGCPAPKVFKNGEGSSLLRFPEKIFDIVSACVKNTNIPVTAKIRLGIDEDSFNGVEVARQIEKAGASAITVHGRFRNQHYSGSVHLDKIKMIKDAVSIPVVGNGDVLTKEDYLKMKQTGVDAVSVARGALGSPWIFSNIKGKKIDVKKIDVIKEYATLLRKEFDDEYLTKYLRKHFLWYLKGYAKSKTQALKLEISKMENVDEVILKMQDFFEKEN